MPISIADRAHIAGAVDDLIRAIELFIHQGGSKSISERLQQARKALLAQLLPSGDQVNLARNSDILDSQFSLSEREALHGLWVSVKSGGRLWGFTLQHTPELALAELRRILKKLSPVPKMTVEQAHAADANNEPAEGEQAEMIDEQARQKAIENLPRAIRRAFLAFVAVARKKEKRLEDLEDHEAHKLLIEEGVPDDADNRGELTDYKPPKSVETFRKYLSKARHALGEPKYTSRRGRSHGKSVVRRDQIEQPDNDDE